MMQWMRWLTGTRTGRAHRGGRYLACGLVLTLVLSLLAACGTSSSITTPNTNPCAATQAPGGASSDSVRYWVPGVFVVGLISNDHALDPDRGDVLTPVTRTVDTILASRDFSVLRLCGAADHPQSSGNPPDLMIFGSANDAIKVGIASFELVQRGSSIPDQADADLTSAVDLINKNVQPVSVNGATMWLAGATPDLLGLGGSGWNVGGSPDGGPSGAGNTVWHPTAGTAGAGKRIWILDAAPSAGNPLVCLANPGTASPYAPTPGSGSTGCPFLYLQEAPFNIPGNIVATAYPPFKTNPGDTSFRQHGQFVGKIIQHMVPGASPVTGAPPELIRVLGDHGGTDLRSLMYGLDQVSTRPNWSPSNTLVNMSLALEPPTECLPNIVHNTDGVRGTLSTPSATMPGAFTQCTETVTTIARTPRDARLFVPIGLVMNSMVSDGFTLVAAAGNESTATSHLGADMPGAFCGVYSVAAVDGLVKPAIGTTSPLAAYSNLPSLDGDPVSGANGNCIAAPIDFTSGSPSVPSVIANPIQYGSNARLAYATGTNVCSYFGDPKYAPPGYTGPPLFAGERALWMGTSFSTPAITALLAGARTYDQPCG